MVAGVVTVVAVIVVVGNKQKEKKTPLLSGWP
jgi:hypothetical protein